MVAGRRGRIIFIGNSSEFLINCKLIESQYLCVLCGIFIIQMIWYDRYYSFVTYFYVLYNCISPLRLPRDEVIV